MSRTVFGSSVLLLCLAAAGCSASPGPGATDARGAQGAPSSDPLPGNPRFFQLLPDDTFWVTHDDKRDRVLATGVRLELSSTGEVLASAWETDKANGGEPLLGGLALAPHAGQGYLFWTQTRVFRAAEFTGPLTPVGLGVTDAAETTIRGIRNGFRSALIATDAGLRELLPGAKVATALPDPAVTDLAALTAERALRIDVFGRTTWTIDGGKTWNDGASAIGTNVRALGVSPEELWIETWQGRALLGKEGPLQPPNNQGYSYRYYIDYSRPFQISFRGTRGDRDDGYWWGYRETQPVQAAVMSGVRFPDGSGFGVVRGAVARVDLSTGKILSIATDWLPNGVECQPHQIGQSVLFACAWDDYQGGSYLLRSDGMEPPHVERFFSDDGAFVADDDGAFGYTGACKAEPRFVDPEGYYGRYGRYGYEGDGVQNNVQPVFCVRRGPEDWVERRLVLDEDTTLVAWIPRKDGTAVALVRGTGRGESLPEPARDPQRETSQNGVRVVRLSREVESWSWPAQQVRSYYSRGNMQQSIIDRRYRALDDGRIVGWLSGNDAEQNYSYSYSPYGYGGLVKVAGGVLYPGGRTEVFELPATPQGMATGGPFGLLATREGKVFETSDRGRTWREAGLSPVAPVMLQGSCSREGCAFSTGARIGWGAPTVAPKITEDKRPEPPKDKPPVPALVCEPQGMPRVEQSNTSPAAATLGSQAKVQIPTSFGAALEMIRETPDAVSTASPYSPYSPYPPPPPVVTAAPSASASAAPKGGKPAQARTHTLVFRLPLDPLGPIIRHNATNAAISNTRSRSAAVPMLGDSGEASYLFFADQNEVFADRSDLVTVPPFDSRRYGYYYADASSMMPGLRTASNRGLLFGDFRRRSSIEEHGVFPQRPPYYFAFDRDVNRRRTIALARRDDGTVGVIILDAAAPETAGAAPFDRLASTIGAMSKLAPWSTVLTGDDPACRADKKAYRTIVNIDPSTWFTLDSAKLPGVTLGKVGIALVRWSEERVCLEAVDVSIVDARRRGDGGPGENLVIRWAAPSGKQAAKETRAAGEAAGALRSLELTQPLTCSMQRSK